MLGGFLKLLPLFIMVLPGAFALQLYPDLGNPDQVFPTLVTDLLPVGIVGIVMAGLIAAIMSTIDSTLNSASRSSPLTLSSRGGRTSLRKRRAASGASRRSCSCS